LLVVSLHIGEERVLRKTARYRQRHRDTLQDYLVGSLAQNFSCRNSARDDNLNLISDFLTNMEKRQKERIRLVAQLAG